MYVVPLDMKTAAEPQPTGWMFVKDDCPFAYDYYHRHFDTLLSESDRLYGRES